MVLSGADLPTKLRQDAIVEAIFELRFDREGLAEVFFGRLLDHPTWKGYQPRRLAGHMVPDQLRQTTPSLKFVPTIETISPDGQCALRVGDWAVSFHRKSPYNGWESFKPELLSVIESLFATAEKLQIRRLGLRYLNALDKNQHGVDRISDLNVSATVAGESTGPQININFISDRADGNKAVVRIATNDFVEGPLSKEGTILVDVDVFTAEGYETKDASKVNEWIELAHTREKEEFFRLFKKNTIDAWKES